MDMESTIAKRPNFCFHNIRLDDGSYTIPDSPYGLIEQDPRFRSAKRILDLMYSHLSMNEKQNIRIADLGCQEGGYTTGFARMGFRAVGIEIRNINYEACMYVKQNTNLPNLHFYKDDVWNTRNYGKSDVIWCSGLLYHLDKPKAFLEYIAPFARKAIFLQTHFAPDMEESEAISMYNLSPLVENEGLYGRWYKEPDGDLLAREKLLCASYENNNSFWLQKAYLLETLKRIGFDMVLESYEHLGFNIAQAMLNKDGFYRKYSRGLFVGIKTDLR